MAFSNEMMNPGAVQNYLNSPFSPAVVQPAGQVNPMDQNAQMIQAAGQATPVGTAPTQAQLPDIPPPQAPWDLSPAAQQIIAEQSEADGVDWFKVLESLGGSEFVQGLAEPDERMPAGQVRTPPQIHNSPFQWAMPGPMQAGQYNMQLKG